ncbi:DUF58 domain-containing protein [Janthinobacterium sp. 17J80-10]|uniref:DUF58 domain-containing protein n=1 Tax=Janthinobacterium sp. 17J80-10 TaxID=2497863 RepID=UPI001005876E|nr:DUF58 domain-containing protein [Janthinobacterium sp. 17J80-10]QAU33846.1 DUF58 domain-containing protein [Janthinobacterium sp. 17J80-10]
MPPLHTHAPGLWARLRQRLERWLFRIGTAEAGEVYLHQRRVFILPTRAGVAFGFMLLVLFIASINYNLSLGFGLTFLLGACAVVDMHLTFRNLAHLHLAPGRVRPVFAGEEAQFELHLANRGKRDRFAIWLGFTGTGLPEVQQPLDLPAASSRSAVAGLATTQRGWLAAPRIRLQTRFPLGLLRAWGYWQPDMRVLVYPRPETDAPPLPLDGSGEADGSGSAGHDDFAGIRAYQSGDSLRQLAWRQIARMDSQHGATLVSKHFEGGAAAELVLEFSRLPGSMDLEMRLSRMARWVLEAEARGLPYAFRLGQVDLAPALGPAHQAACLQELALFGMAGTQ